MKELTVSSVGEDVKCSYTAGAMDIFWKQFDSFLKSLNIYLSYDPAILLPKRNDSTHPHTDLYINVHSNFIYNSQKLEATQMSTNRAMDKETVVHPFNGILIANTKKWNLDSHSNIDGS